MIYAKIQSQQNKNRSIHWTREYGILNCVNEPSLDRTRPQKPLKDTQLVNLLPSEEVQDNLNTRWAAMVARVVCKYLDKFSHLRSALVYHIPYRYSKEMANKSVMVKIVGTFYRQPTVHTIICISLSRCQKVLENMEHEHTEQDQL